MKPKITVEELSEDAKKLFEILSNESDIACVVVGAAYIDEAMAEILTHILKKSNVSSKMLDTRGILGNFMARADLLYSFKKISKSHYQDLCVIAEIRNLFAHSHLELSFADKDIQTHCSKLRIWRMPFFVESDDGEIEYTDDDLSNIARNQFNLSVSLLASRFVLLAMSLKHELKKHNEY